MKSAALAIALAATMLVACFPKTVEQAPTLTAAQVTAAGARTPASTPESLEHGRATFTAKCNGCHGYPDVGAVPEAKWPEIMTSMSKKAKLTPDESADTLRFIQAAASH